MRRVIRAFLAILLVAPAALRGQSASSTAKAFFQAQTDKRWQAMADFVDSASLKALRGIADRMTLTMSTLSSPEGRARMDSAGVSDMAKALEGLQAMLGGPGSMLRFTFARVTDAAELQAISDRELMGRWFEARSAGYLAGLTTDGMLKGMLDKIESTKLNWEIVGEIAEGDGVSHVVYRVAGMTPQAPTGILTFRASGRRWYIRFASPNEQLGHMATLGTAAQQRWRP